MDEENELETVERPATRAEVVGHTVRHVVSVAGFCFVVYVLLRWDK